MTTPRQTTATKAPLNASQIATVMPGFKKGERNPMSRKGKRAERKTVSASHPDGPIQSKTVVGSSSGGCNSK